MADLDCIVAGEANVDLLIDGVAALEFDKEKLAKGCGLSVGGSSAITAFVLARHGARVGFVTVIGQDLFGHFVEERMRSAAIDLSAVRHDKTTQTGITVWCQNRKRRAGLTCLGTIAALRPADITDSYLARAKHFHVGAYFLLKNFQTGAARVFERARRLGLTTSLDCNFDPAEKWNSGIHSVLKHVDVFLPNETEALALTGASSARAAAGILATEARVVVVKMGAKGALIATQENTFHVPAPKTRVIDSTGAGDSFNAGFLERYIHKASLEDCARAGVNAGARSVQHIGGTAAFE